jgi:chromosome segregation ATPase
MAMRVEAVILLAALAGCGADTVDVRPHAQDSLLQTWTKALDGNNAQETPITRVVNLLKEMQGTLKKEMDEDEELYEKLACWCNNNKYEKNEAIEAAEAQIASLESKIDQLTAKSAELKTLISETTAQLAADKEELEKATAIRQKQLKAMHQEELDGIQNIENLKAAIMVLGKHHAAFPQVSLLGWSSHHKKGKKR